MLRIFFTIYSFFLRITQFFHSFNYSFNNAVKIFIQWIYSFKKNAKYSFKEVIHSKKMKIIHSKKIFIQVKNGLSPRASRVRSSSFIASDNCLLQIWISACLWKKFGFRPETHDMNCKKSSSWQPSTAKKNNNN